ncbi:MAG: DUF4932 domain-containing protein [Chitinophagaceae bacterium]
MRSALIFSIIAFSLASCSFHANNWHGTDVPGNTQASFDYFNDKSKHTIQLTKGQVLFTNYKITGNSGKLKLEVKQGSNLLWQKQFAAASDTAAFFVVAPKTGEYTVVVSGDHAAGSFAVHYNAAEPRQPEVKINRNIELFGLMLQLDNGGDILPRKDTVLIDGRQATWQQWYAMMMRNYPKYKQFDTCQVMNIYRKMQADGYFNDFFANLLLQVDEVPKARINATTDSDVIMAFSAKGDSTAALQKVNAFLEAFNAFYKTVDFDAYLAANKQYYDLAQSSVIKSLPESYLLPVMEHYYRKQFNNYCFVPSLNMLTSTGYGKMNKNTRTIYDAFGSFSFISFDNAHPDMGFSYPEKIKVLAVHEFGHSFANPSVDNLPSSLIAATKYLYEPIRKQMTERAYPSWTICLYEHFVKAGEAIIAEKIGDSTRAQIFIQDAIKSGFIYVPFIVNELKQWDKNNGTDASFDEAVLNTVKKLAIAYKK